MTNTGTPLNASQVLTALRSAHQTTGRHLPGCDCRSCARQEALATASHAELQAEEDAYLAAKAAAGTLLAGPEPTAAEVDDENRRIARAEAR